MFGTKFKLSCKWIPLAITVLISLNKAKQNSKRITALGGATRSRNFPQS